MAYLVLDVAELIDHFNIPVESIEECTSVWGDEDGVGFCLTTTDGYYWIESVEGEFWIQQRGDRPWDVQFDLGIFDAEEGAFDVNEWLAKSGRLDEAHQY